MQITGPAIGGSEKTRRIGDGGKGEGTFWKTDDEKKSKWWTSLVLLITQQEDIRMKTREISTQDMALDKNEAG